MEENLKIEKIPASSFAPLVHSEAVDEQEKIVAPTLNFVQDSWRRLKKNKGAVISFVILIMIVLISFGGIWFSPHNPTKQNTAYNNLPPRIPGISINGFNGTAMVAGKRIDKYEEAKVPQNVHFYLGTDELGRDELSRLLMGTRVSLIIAFVAALLDLTIGVAYGLVSGLSSNRVDNMMQRILEVLSGIPTLVVLIIMLTIFEPGMLSIIMAMIVTGWITMARIVRGQTLKIKDQEYVLAAKTLGESPLKIATKHILPNISGVVIVQMMFSIPTAIFFEAFLGFIGLGIRPPGASLGRLLSDGFRQFQYYPHLLWVPAITLSVTMICFNLLADGLRDAFDPKMKD